MKHATRRGEKLVLHEAHIAKRAHSTPPFGACMAARAPLLCLPGVCPGLQRFGNARIGPRVGCAPRILAFAAKELPWQAKPRYSRRHAVARQRMEYPMTGCC